MTVPKRGEDALVDRLVAILTDNLQDAVDALLTEASDPFDLTVGEVVGKVTDEPLTRPNSVLVGVLDSGDLTDQPYNYGGAVRRQVTALVRAQVATTLRSELDQRRRIMGAAVRRTVREHLVRDGNPAGCQGLPRMRVLDRDSSQMQATGSVGMRLAPGVEHPTVENLDVLITVRQLVDEPAPF